MDDTGDYFLSRLGPESAIRAPRDKFLHHTVRLRVSPGPLAESVGVFPFQWIEVGRDFYRCPPRMQRAILLHEMAHIYGGHQMQRILHFFDALFRPEKFRELCHNQEYEADEFAATCGFGPELCQLYAVLQQQDYPSAALYPDLPSRIQRIKGA